MPRNILTFLRIVLPFVALMLLGVWPNQKLVGEGLDLARQAEKGHQPGLAASSLRKVIAREPFRKSLWEQIGRDEQAAGNPGRAEEAFLSAREAGDLSLEGLKQLAVLSEGEGKWGTASNLWGELAAEAPSGEVYARLVSADRRSGQPLKALAAARSWQDDFPQDANASYAVAVLAAAADPAEALRSLETCPAVPICRTSLLGLRTAAAQATQSDDPGYRQVVLGRWLGSLGEWDLAESAFQTATVDSPGYAEGWAFLGQARLQNGKDGLSDLEKALQVNPDSVLARALMALYWGKVGDFSKAIEQMQAASRLEPGRAVWQVELGNLTAAAGDLIAAQKFFLKAEDLEPENPLVWEAQANFSVHYNVEPRDLGLPAARRLVDLRPDDPSSLDTLASVLIALGDLRGAERILQQSLQIDANYASAHYHLGQVYFQLSEQDQAMEQLQRALDLDKGGPVGLMAGRLLERIQNPDGN